MRASLDCRQGVIQGAVAGAVGRQRQGIGSAMLRTYATSIWPRWQPNTSGHATLDDPASYLRDPCPGSVPCAESGGLDSDVLALRKAATP
jgi:hypothetical protein